MSKTILISAAEISGDRHAANLVRAIKKLDPSIKFIGFGGEFLKKEGVDIIYDITNASTIGILEPLRFLPKIFTAYNKMLKVMKDQKPDIFIPIDSQGFHMLLLKKAKQLNIPAVYYISPQEWQWGTAEGGKKVVSLVKKILAIFPEEETFYNKCGGDATYVGHPCVESVKQNTISRENFIKKNNIDSEKLIFSIFPGSRQQELNYLLPLFLETVEEFCKDKKTLLPIISVSSPKYKKKILASLKRFKKTSIKIYEADSIQLIQHSHIILSSSGTITLETALQGIPSVVAYKFHPITYWFAKTFFSNKVNRIKYISLPNLMLNKKVMPEFLQKDANVINLLDQLNRLLDQSNRNKIKHQLSKLKTKLEIENAAEKAANSVLSVLS